MDIFYDAFLFIKKIIKYTPWCDNLFEYLYELHK